MLTFRPLPFVPNKSTEHFDIMQATATTPNPNYENTILTPRIKVLHIISGDLWAGAETQAFTLITTIGNQCDTIVALMNHGELEERLKETGTKTIVIDEKLVSSMKITQRLAELIKKFQPDIIHTHRQKENILGSVANLIANSSLFHRTKSVRTTHGAPEHKAIGLKRAIIWLDNFCGRYLQDAIISVSADLHEKLKGTFPENKIYTIQNGIDIDGLNKITPAEDIRNRMKDGFHVGIIGRLEPVKRVDIFIKAAHQILMQDAPPKITFHIIGDGSLKKDLTALTLQLDIANYIVFHGHRSDSVRTIAAMDLVIMCSDHEGTPMTALETLALGKPLIANNVGGLREILSEHPQLLVNQHSAAGYSSKILELLHHPYTPTLKDDYTNHQNAARTLTLYKKLANNSVE